jgi:O-antigen/teichoic acid export membrane protein
VNHRSTAGQASPPADSTPTRLDSILHNTFFSFIARGIDVVVLFALSIILTRYLGPEGMGRYNYVIAFVGIFVPLIDLGLDHILIREIARRKDISTEYVGAVIFLKLLIMVGAIPLGMAAVFFIGAAEQAAWAIFLCFLGAMAFRETPTVVAFALFLANERMEFRALVTLVYQIIKITVVLAVVLLGGGITAIFGGLLIAEAGQGLIALRLMLKRFVKPRLVFNPHLWKFLVKESFPIGVAFALNNYYFRVDVLLLTHFRTIRETGLFSVPFNVVTTLFTLLIPTIWILLPHLTKAYKESLAKLHLDGQGYLKAIFVVTAGIAIYLCLEARELTLTLFGQKFEESALIMAVIAPAVVSHAILYFFDLTLTATGKQKFVMLGSVVIFGVKLIAALIFIPKYGIMGAAIGTLAADVATFLVMYNVTRKNVTSFDFWKIMVKPVAAALAGGLFLWFIRGWPFYITAILFGLVYTGFVWIFGVISPDQKQRLVGLVQDRRLFRFTRHDH